MSNALLHERIRSERHARRVAASDNAGAAISAAVAETQATIARALKEAPSAGNAARLERLEERLRADQARLAIHAEAHARLLDEVTRS